MPDAAGSSIQSLLTGEVLAATSSASFKLIFICVAVGWLLKTDRLPKETAPVLTQVHLLPQLCEIAQWAAWVNHNIVVNHA